MVDLTTDENGQVRARLLDLVPGRSKKAYADWLTQRGGQFRAGVQVATLDPFHGYKAAIDDELAEATAVLDVFHVVALGTKCVDVEHGGGLGQLIVDRGLVPVGTGRVWRP